MKKKLLFLVPFVAMVMSGCSSPATPSSSSGPAPTTSETPTTSGTTSPTSETTTQPGPGPTTESTTQPGPGPTSTSESTTPTPVPVPVTGIKVNSSYDVSLEVGGTSQIDASVLPENADDKVLLYSSTKAEVATVSDAGLVTAVGVGKATINVVSHENADIKKTINVVVEPAGFLPASETDDGYSLVTNVSQLSNGDSLKIVGYIAGEPYSIKSDAYYTAEKISYSDSKVVTSASMEFVFEAHEDEGVSYAAIKTLDDKYIGCKGNDNGIQTYDDLSSGKTHLSAEIDSNGYAVVTAAEGSKNTLLLNAASSTPYIRFYAADKVGSYRKVCLYRKAPVVLSSIEITSGPDKVDYFEGDALDLTGLVVNKVYSDLHKEVATAEEYDVSPSGRTLLASDTEIVVSLKADPTKTASKTITVTPVQLSSISVADSTSPKASYVLGESFDKNSVVVTAHYNDVRKDKEVAAADYTVSPATFEEAGEEVVVTISYTEGLNTVSATKKVQVINKSITNIELVGEPTKTVYYAGETFDKSTVTVKATYNDSSVDNDYKGYSVSPEGELKEGDAIKLSVSSLEIDLSSKVSVVADELDSISVAADSAHATSFNAGETFSSAGLKINKNMKSGKVNAVTTGFSTDKDGHEFGASDIGTVSVTVTLDTKNCSYDVTVNDAVQSLSINTPATKLAFKVGEAFSAEGLKLDVTYYKAAAEVISSGYTTNLDDYAFVAADVATGKTVTVSYGGKTVDYNVTVSYAGLLENGNYVISAYSTATCYCSAIKASGGQPLATQTIDEAAVLTFTLIGQNTYSIMKGSDYMYCTDSNNGVRYGSTVDSWVISSVTVSDVNYFMVTDTLYSRILALYNVQDWRCYKNSSGVQNLTITPATSVTGVALDQSSATMSVGGADVTLAATVSPSGATAKGVVWSSDNEAVATVENGVVHAVAAGSATITVTTLDGSFTDTCNVTVQKPAFVGYVLSSKSVEVATGGTVTIDVTPNPADSEIPADTAAGMQTGGEYIQNYNYSEGVLTITASSTAGTATMVLSSTTASVVSDTITITVTAGAIAVTDVEVSPSEATLGIGDTKELTATVLPSNATDKSVSWSSSDNSIATVSSTGLVTAVAAGNATITCTTTDGGKTATCEITVQSEQEIAKADFTTKKVGHAAYNDSWSYDGWEITSGANNNKGWAYVKFGSKDETSCFNGSVKSAQISHTINHIDVAIAAGSLSKSGMSVDEWGVYVYSDSDLSAQVDHVVSTDSITSAAANFSLTPTTGTCWAKDLYYVVYFNCSNTSSTNGIVCVSSIAFIG